MNEGQRLGYLDVGSDFGVEVTEAGRAWVAEGVEQQSAGCDAVDYLGATWMGFELTLRSLCTDAERLERMGLPPDYLEPPTGEVAGPGPVRASGFAPPPQSPSQSDPWFESVDWDCLLHVIGFGVAVVSLFVFLTAPWAGWALFWLSWSVVGTSFFLTLLSWVQNCTQVLDVEASEERWFSYNAPTLPLATIGAAGLFRIGDPLALPPVGDAYWVTVRYQCTFGAYLAFKWSSVGNRSVPTKVRWNC